MRITKSALLAQFPEFENRLSSEARAALTKAFSYGGDFTVVCLSDWSGETERRTEPQMVFLCDADAVVFFEGQKCRSVVKWLNSTNGSFHPARQLHLRTRQGRGGRRDHLRRLRARGRWRNSIDL